MRQILSHSLLILWFIMVSPVSYSDNSIYTITYPEALQQRLISALNNKGSEYKARTRHVNNGQPVYTNRLIFADSPYLLQHAHNPVNWYTWGEEAFAAAKRENKPVFLSIGYATCHWCHVMEEESFESIDVAKILNEHFISIKVDREQHPDIDATYMTAVTLLTGRGGWPMSSFITHEGKPFFGGTYYPQTTFINLLMQVKSAWDRQHQTILTQANQLAEAVEKETSRQGAVATLEQSAVQSAIQQTLSRYDSQNGGFSSAPKFPNEPLLILLLQAAERHKNPPLLEALDRTLSAMAQGGIYDQIGGGFHRYSTDERWLVPHFEKMLYNQAYLARVYARAYRLTHNPLYARVVRQTLDYVVREMSNTNDVFYSATDADSEGEEGTYFVWTIEDINKLLSPRDASFIIELFSATQGGNFGGKNIFFLAEPLQKTAKQRGETLTTLLARLDPLLETLRKYRQTRSPPLTDNKIIVAWNGMVITALVEAGDILNEPRYINAAKTATAALWKSQRTNDGVLWRINLDGKSSIPAKQDDYAHFAEALLTLYDVTNNPPYLQMAQQLTDEMVNQFMDVSSGILAMGRDPLLFTQPKDAYDGALPSGNAVAARIFYRLFNRTGQEQYHDHATKIFQAFSNNIIRQPAAYSYMLAQLDELKNGEVSAHQYAARSAIKVDAKIDSLDGNRYILNIHFKIKPGWHINAHKPIQKQLIATTINIVDSQHWQLSEPRYPQPELINTDISREPLALYQGEFKITAKLSAKTGFKIDPIKISLNLQACNQDSCLAPETLLLFPGPV